MTDILATNHLGLISLQSKAPLVCKLLGEQIYDKHVEYKWASFVFNIDISCHTVFYNLFTKQLVVIERKSEAVHFEELVKDWFLIPVKMDESAIVKDFKQLVGNVHNMSGVIRDYTIFTTTDCNARCAYCFENGAEKVRMDNHTIEQTICFIKEQYNNQSIHIQWFGGEPLYNLKAINQISCKLNQDGVLFTSDMTTNGYLFSEKIVNQAINYWHLKKVQITLDGTEHVYNITKNYIHHNSNPFLKVLNNIECLLLNNIIVVVRLNLTLENKSDLIALVQILESRFENFTNLFIYPIPLFELIEKDETRKQIYEDLYELQSHIFKLGHSTDYDYFDRVRINHCKADNNGNSIVIFPDGHIGLCEHQWGKTYIGHVEGGLLDRLEIEKWKEYCPPKEKCGKCLFYADCLKLRLCDTNNSCHDEQIQFDKNLLTNTIIKKYNKWKNETEI